jgi:outer membrane protein OmpA-like peptidoglycan-associated protein
MGGQGETMKKLSILKTIVALFALSLITPVMAQDRPRTASQQPTQMSQPSQATMSDLPKLQITPGAKMTVKGVIVKHDGDNLLMRDQSGAQFTVLVGNAKIEEKKSNPFRGAKKYTPDQLLRGLNVEVEGRGDQSGALAASKIKIATDDFKVARAIDSQVVPLEDRLTVNEQNAQRLSGQLEELNQVANLAKGGAAAAQDTADAAVEGVNKTNDRISSLDDYEVKNTSTVTFKVGSAVLSPEAKATLDQIAEQAKSEKGFVLQIRGFASSDGSENMNRALSQRRADAVIHYLAETHDIPLRRIVVPFGYGEAMPVADNSTLEGRKQNRRTEISILVSRAYTSPVNVTRPASTSGNNNNQQQQQQ